MKFVHKLEIGLGIATFLSITLYTCYLFYYFGFERLLNDPVRGNSYDGIVVVLFIVWLFSLLVSIGAYLNAAQQSTLAILPLGVGAMFMIIILVPLGFFVLMNSGVLAGLLMITPAVFAFITLILAITFTLKEKLDTERKRSI